jgi:hypothetical protein
MRNGGRIPNGYVDPHRRSLGDKVEPSRLHHAPDLAAMINDHIEVNPRNLRTSSWIGNPEVVHGFMRAVRGTFVSEEQAEA